jgi:hypothetical protein
MIYRQLAAGGSIDVLSAAAGLAQWWASLTPETEGEQPSAPVKNRSVMIAAVQADRLEHMSRRDILRDAGLLGVGRDEINALGRSIGSRRLRVQYADYVAWCRGHRGAPTGAMMKLALERNSFFAWEFREEFGASTAAAIRALRRAGLIELEHTAMEEPRLSAHQHLAIRRAWRPRVHRTIRRMPRYTLRRRRRWPAAEDLPRGREDSPIW